uniref:Anoctamin n=1 Tax=Tetraodon nigroviridis TaxID=99883 RepID=H3CGP9_TETNG
MLKSQTPEEQSPCQRGLYFEDGERRVDYVLTYHVKKPSGGRSGRQASLLTENAVARSLRRGPKHPQQHGGQRQSSAGVDVELGYSGGTFSSQEDQKTFRREEFERQLVDMGLELEKDEDTKTQGVGFLKIHAPWNVLCREAELMKLKMPTKKVYEVKQSGSVTQKISSLVSKILEPLHPHVEEHQPKNIKHLSHTFSREKQHLFDLSDKESFFDSKTRSSIVFEILKRTKSKAKYNVGITSLLGSGVYMAAYPLHDGDINEESVESNDRKLLYEEWANYSVFFKYQPVGLVRKYFGEKIALYFAWLGLYTQMLIPASLVGVIVFLYGCATVDDNIPSMEICHPENNITMCPLCDRVCSYWKLSSACGTARASHLFDNPATVFFSIFMALWAAMFMEHWKRRQMRLNYEWDLTGFEDEEDHPRAEYEFQVLQKSLRKHQESKPKMEKLTYQDRLPAYMTNVVMMLLMIGVTFAIVFGVIFYRISTKAALHMSSNPITRSHVQLTVKTTAAIINLVVILILDEVYGAVARWLTVLGTPVPARTPVPGGTPVPVRTQVPERTPVLTGTPVPEGLTLLPAGLWSSWSSTQSPLDPLVHMIWLGCWMFLHDLSLQGANIIQLTRWDNETKANANRRGSGRVRNARPPLADLAKSVARPVIQFGFVTLFVASFPLAPLFALLNNIIEIRLDAKKFVTELRRPVAARAKDIGIWYNILRGVAKVAVIINAFVISFTSDFIPRMVYQYKYSPDGSMHGFVNHTLSFFNISCFQEGREPLDQLHLGYPVDICRFTPSYLGDTIEYSSFEFKHNCSPGADLFRYDNVVMLMSDVVDWLIPDIPKDISVQIHEKILLVELFMKEEQGK